MKKSINKKILSIAVIILIIVGIAGVFYVKSKPTKPQDSAPITATVRKASFSSVVNVTISDIGKEQYKGSKTYQIYYEGKAVTKKEEIGKPTTAYPAREENDKVTIKLFKSDDSEAYSVELNLKKEDKVK